MKYLEYPLFAEGFVNRFLISEVHTQVREFTRSTLNGRVNEWLKKGFAIHENPCRKEFVEERRREVPDYPDFAEMRDGDKLKQYFPFGICLYRAYLSMEVRSLFPFSKSYS